MPKAERGSGTVRVHASDALGDRQREKEDIALDVRPEDEPPGIHVSGESIFRSDKGIAHGTSCPPPLPAPGGALL